MIMCGKSKRFFFLKMGEKVTIKRFSRFSNFCFRVAASEQISPVTQHFFDTIIGEGRDSLIYSRSKTYCVLSPGGLIVAVNQLTGPNEKIIIREIRPMQTMY